jgi:iron complex outermembrane receptor protein
MNKKYLVRGISSATVVTLVTGLTGLAIPLTATAQVADLEEVVVTARKREEKLQDVPVAITVFSGEALQEAGISAMRELFENTPGLNFDSTTDALASFPAVRGVVSTELSTNRAKVTTFLDGMPILGQQGTVPFLAIQQVEVLRGPQSAAFGRSTFGGAISYTTVDPGDTFKAELSAELGSDNKQNLAAIAGGPLIDGLLKGLVAVSSDKRDGQDDWKTVVEQYQLGNENAQALLAKLILTPGPNTSIELRYKWQDLDNGPPARAFMDLNDPNRKIHPEVTTALRTCGVFAVPARPSCAYQGTINALANPTFNSNFSRALVDDPHVVNKRDRYELEAEHEFGSGLSAQVMGFTSTEFYERYLDFNFANDTAGYFRNPSDIKESYAEARLTSPGADRFRYGVGVSWYDYEFQTLIYMSAPTYAARAPGGGQINEVATNVGYFFNTAFDITDQWTVSLEGRYALDEVGGTARQADGSFSAPLTKTTKSFLPRLALTYSPSPTTTFYAQVAKGTNPAAVVAGALDNRVIAASRAYPDAFDVSKYQFFEEETVVNYEIGVKGTVNRRFSYAADAYMIDWKGFTQAYNLNFEPLDFATYDLNADGIGDANTKYANMSFRINRAFLQSGDLTGYGAEFAANFQATETISLGLSAAYIHLTYDDGSCTATINLNYGVTPNATTANGSRCTSIAGNSTGTQPELSGAFNATYKRPLANGMEWFTRLNTTFNGKQYDSEMNLATLPAYSITGLRTGLSRGGWRTEAYVDNLFDDDTPSALLFGNDGRLVNPNTLVPLGANQSQNLVYTPRRSRSFGLRASYKF